jgi:hypothetical protein
MIDHDNAQTKPLMDACEERRARSQDCQSRHILWGRWRMGLTREDMMRRFLIPAAVLSVLPSATFAEHLTRCKGEKAQNFGVISQHGEGLIAGYKGR